MDSCGLGKCHAEPEEQLREPSGTSMGAVLQSQHDEGG